MNVLIVAAHSDDEVLGCGGTICRHVAGGDKVQCVFMTDGVASRNSASAKTEALQRRDAANRAATMLGTLAPQFFDFPDNAMDAMPLLTIVQAIEKVAGDFQPDIVYTHHVADLNVDHRLTAQAALTAFRPLPGRNVRTIYGFEVTSSTEWSADSAGQVFQPQRAVDIADFLDKKLAAILAYEQEMRPFPHPRSARALRALAEWRGATFGLEAAEAFTIYRDILG